MSKETILVSKGVPSESRVFERDGLWLRYLRAGASFREGWALGGDDV